MNDLLVRWLLACALSICVAGAAHAQLEFEITDFVGKRTPIAVVPFGWEGEAPEAPYDIDGVIAADLNRSGRFRPIPDEDMLQKPTASVEIDFDDWSILNVEAVVIGKIIQTGRERLQRPVPGLFDVFKRGTAGRLSHAAPAGLTMRESRTGPPT